nr:hypothetical protein [Actinomycetota bacterium]
ELIRSGLDPGSARTRGSLTLVPLFGGAPAKEYLLASEAIPSGLLTISEMGAGSVTGILAHNQADLPVLLLDVEHVEGAMQNRVLNVTVLVAANQKTILPVACVERGRWHYEGGSDFAPSSDITYSRLRSKNAAAAAVSARHERGRGVDQHEVWADVSAKHAEIGVDESATGSMRHAYDQRRRELEEMTASFSQPEPDQTGVIACVGGTAVALDAFDRPETLTKLWTRLVSGYAMDALGARPVPVAGNVTSSFLQAAANSETTSHDGVGLGREVVLTSPATVGHALAWQGGIVHLALFRVQGGNDRDARTGGRIASPRGRRRLQRFPEL